MKTTLRALVLALVLMGAPLKAQDQSSGSTPATIVLSMREILSLDTTQVARLRDLEKTQSAALSRVIASLLRAEADLVDANRSDDPVLRRAALEKRSKLAIDAEIGRMKWEKDTRAILTARQAEYLPVSIGGPASVGARPALWRPLIAPLSISVPNETLPDSAEVRISITPNYADIYINGEKRASGRKFIYLPVGKYELKFYAANCTEVVQPLAVVKGPPIVITQALTCTK